MLRICNSKEGVLYIISRYKANISADPQETCMSPIPGYEWLHTCNSSSFIRKKFGGQVSTSLYKSILTVTFPVTCRSSFHVRPISSDMIKSGQGHFELRCGI